MPIHTYDTPHTIGCMRLEQNLEFILMICNTVLMYFPGTDTPGWGRRMISHVWSVRAAMCFAPYVHLIGTQLEASIITSTRQFALTARRKSLDRKDTKVVALIGL